MSVKGKRELYNALLATAISCIICFAIVLVEQLILTKIDSTPTRELIRTYAILGNATICTIIYIIMYKLIAPAITEKIIVKQIKASKHIFLHHKGKEDYTITRVQLVEINSLNSIECVDVDQNKYNLSEKDLRSLFY